MRGVGVRVVLLPSWLTVVVKVELRCCLSWGCWNWFLRLLGRGGDPTAKIQHPTHAREEPAAKQLLLVESSLGQHPEICRDLSIMGDQEWGRGSLGSWFTPLTLPVFVSWKFATGKSKSYYSKCK